MSNTDLQHKQNIYICKKLHHTITIDRDKGVTPMFITCETEGCKQQARSSFYPHGLNLIPSHEWYKPTDEEILAESKAFAAANKMSLNAILEPMRDHCSQGGLLLRKITEEGEAVYVSIDFAGYRKAQQEQGQKKAPVVMIGGRNAGKAAMVAERYGTTKAGSLKPRTAVPKKIIVMQGRNEACQCGSGKKFKKCCLPEMV